MADVPIDLDGDVGESLDGSPASLSLTGPANALEQWQRLASIAGARS
jgi:hypothetical protein